MTGNDQVITQHVFGERFDVAGHACPECPSQLTVPGKIQLAPNVFCRHCRGTGLLTTAELAAWQREQFASGA